MPRHYEVRTRLSIEVYTVPESGRGVQHPLIACSLHCVFVPGPPAAPGPLESVNYQPDILSILLSWDLPQRGRGYITTVTLEYYNSEGVKLGTESVSESRKSYRCSACCISTCTCTCMVMVLAE